MKEGDGDVQPPLHAVGKGFYGLTVPLRQLNRVQGGLNPLLQAPAPEAVKTSEKPEVVPGRQGGIKGKILGDQAQAGLVFPWTEGDIAALD
jgi:hypothetical protein